MVINISFYRCGYSSGVERNLAKVDVEGSNPFARSIFYKCAFEALFFIPCGQRDYLHGRRARTTGARHGGLNALHRYHYSPYSCSIFKMIDFEKNNPYLIRVWII